MWEEQRTQGSSECKTEHALNRKKKVSTQKKNEMCTRVKWAYTYCSDLLFASAHI
jgi:hypothetical protein